MQQFGESHLDPIEMAIVAAGISKQYGVRIDVSGTGTARTSYDKDGTMTITIPSITADTPGFGILLRGYIDHEAAHARFTDMPGLRKLIDDPDFKMTPILMNILNVLEDVYVERKMSGCYRGCGYNLGNIAKWIFTESEDAKAKIESKWVSDSQRKLDIMDLVFDFILYTMRASNTASGITKEILDLIKTRMQKRQLQDIITKVEPILQRALVEGTSTVANAHLAREILDAIIDCLPSQPQGNGQGDGQGDVQDDGQSSDSGSGGSGGGESGGSESGEDEDGPEKPEDNPFGDGEDTGRSSSRNYFDKKIAQDNGYRLESYHMDAGKTLDDFTLGNNSKQPKVGIGALAGAKLSEGADKQLCGSYLKWSDGSSTCGLSNVPLVSREDAMRSGMYRGHHIAKSAAKAVKFSARLASRLSSLLQAYTMQRGGVGRMGGIDAHKLHRLSVNDARVFTRREVRPGVNTEFVILYDASSSMSVNVKWGGGIDNLSNATGYVVYGIMKALRTLHGTKSSAWGFIDDGVFPIYEKHEPIKDPVLAFPNGCTPLAEALVKMPCLFDNDEHSRKVIIVLTDGMPDNVSLAEAVIAKLRSKGYVIVACGIGSCSDTVASLFSHSADEVADIADMDRLPDVLYRVIRKNIVQGGM